MQRLKDLTAEDLRRNFSYDPLTGEFRRLSGPRKGCVAGAIDSWGHRQIRISGTLYMASRLAWLFVTGEWPADQVDHRNLKRDDDRFLNLRLADQSGNTINQDIRSDNTSGFKGVSPWNNKWQASIMKSGKLEYLGVYQSKLDAVLVYRDAAIRLHGEFARFSVSVTGSAVSCPLAK